MGGGFRGEGGDEINSLSVRFSSVLETASENFRNIKRFPEDFMFQLNYQEVANLRSRIATSSSEYGGRRYLPFVFTEQGVAMLSSVLNSDRAIEVNIEIMRAFVKLRQLLTTHKDLAKKFEELEEKYDGKFKIVFEAIRRLMLPQQLRRKTVH